MRRCTKTYLNLVHAMQIDQLIKYVYKSTVRLCCDLDTWNQWNDSELHERDIKLLRTLLFKLLLLCEPLLK